MENTGLMVRVSSGISCFIDLNSRKIAEIVGTTNGTAVVSKYSFDNSRLQ